MLNEKIPTEITKDDHAKRLIKILELNSTCTCCPYPNFDRFSISTFKPDIICCDMCRTFIGLSTMKDKITDYKCPCHLLKQDEVFKRSWLALEEGGYI